VTAVFGDFLGPAGDHIAAAMAFRDDLDYSSHCGIVCQLDRLTATFQHYLADLPLPDALDPSRNPERNAASRAMPAMAALDRAAQTLRPAAAALNAHADNSHPAVGHLATAAGYLAAGRDLLNTHFILGADAYQARLSYWAPAITSGPVTAALLAELGSYAQDLGSWTGWLTRRTGHAGMPTSGLAALRGAQPWLTAAGTALFAAQQAHYPPGTQHAHRHPGQRAAPRQEPGRGETATQLSHRICLTAERLRYAAYSFTDSARWSPAATSVSWRRDAQASAITGHASEIILRALADRAGRLRLEPGLHARLNNAADSMHQAWQSWRTITDQWDILTTGTPRSPGITPVAAEIPDLALLTGRLAYANPQWTPATADTSPPRHPQSLASSPADIITVLSAIHHAADATVRIATEDHKAVLAARDDNRLYVPVRLLSDKYDIPHPYTAAPPAHLGALGAAYDNAIKATTLATVALDELAIAVSAPSSMLALARRAAAGSHRGQRRHPRHQAARQAPTVTAARLPGRTEKALLKLQIRDPALLLRAAVIDQAASELIAESTTRARSRHSFPKRTFRPAVDAHGPGRPPPRVASQDLSPRRAPITRPRTTRSSVSRGNPPRRYPANLRPYLLRWHDQWSLQRTVITRIHPVDRGHLEHFDEQPAGFLSIVSIYPDMGRLP
jgi:hypothetical protein